LLYHTKTCEDWPILDIKKQV